MQFATKPRLASGMIAATPDAGITASWVTGDEAYGQDPQLRTALEVRGIGYVMAVACSTRVRINTGRTLVRADTVASRLPASVWHRQSAGNGAKGPRYYDWVWVHIGIGSHRPCSSAATGPPANSPSTCAGHPPKCPCPNWSASPVSAGALRSATRSAPHVGTDFHGPCSSVSLWGSGGMGACQRVLA
uniref:transposase n=1 Tax=Streptomyces marianii TaxID=1817406 RepID=UPI0026B0D86B